MSAALVCHTFRITALLSLNTYCSSFSDAHRQYAFQMSTFLSEAASACGAILRLSCAHTKVVKGYSLECKSAEGSGDLLCGGSDFEA